MKLGIDASNIRSGGGLNHLKQIVKLYDPDNCNFKVCDVYITKGIRAELPCNKNINFRIISNSWQDNVRTEIWRHRFLPQVAKNYNIIFSPGGCRNYKFSNYVTMFRNMLPFEYRNIFRFGLSTTTIRLLILRYFFVKGFRYAKGIICLTDYAKNLLITKHGINSKKITVIQHGVNKQFTSTPRGIKPVINYNQDNRFKWLYVSILVNYKHQPNVINAIQQLNGDGFPFSLDLIGSYNPNSLKKVNRAIKSSHVRYLGEMNHDKLIEFMKKADGFIFASSCENLPNILIEKMAFGRPLVCSDYGIIKEIVGKKGIYFNPTSINSIKIAIKKLFQNQQLRIEQVNVFQRQGRKYDWKNCYDRTLQFLSKCSDS